MQELNILVTLLSRFCSELLGAFIVPYLGEHGKDNWSPLVSIPGVGSMAEDSITWRLPHAMCLVLLLLPEIRDHSWECGENRIKSLCMDLGFFSTSTSEAIGNYSRGADRTVLGFTT